MRTSSRWCPTAKQVHVHHAQGAGRVMCRFAVILAALARWAARGEDAAAGKTLADNIAVGMGVVAVSQLVYSSSTEHSIIPAGAEGEVDNLTTILLVRWHVQPEEMLGAVSGSYIEQMSCALACPGLQGYLAALDAGRRDSSTDPIQKCYSIQESWDVTACLLASEQAELCHNARAPVEEERDACAALGVDISQAPTPTVFTMSPCHVCSYLAGAAPLVGSPIPSRLYVTREQCETMCIEDDACMAYDYQASSGYGRMWRSCPLASRAPGLCSWTIYDKPASMVPEEDSPTGGGGGQGVDTSTPGLSTDWQIIGVVPASDRAVSSLPRPPVASTVGVVLLLVTWGCL